jgi:hypothetical protein
VKAEAGSFNTSLGRSSGLFLTPSLQSGEKEVSGMFGGNRFNGFTPLGQWGLIAGDFLPE